MQSQTPESALHFPSPAAGGPQDLQDTSRLSVWSSRFPDPPASCTYVSSRTPESALQDTSPLPVWSSRHRFIPDPLQALRNALFSFRYLHSHENVVKLQTELRSCNRILLPAALLSEVAVVPKTIWQPHRSALRPRLASWAALRGSRTRHQLPRTGGPTRPRWRKHSCE